METTAGKAGTESGMGSGICHDVLRDGGYCR